MRVRVSDYVRAISRVLLKVVVVVFFLYMCSKILVFATSLSTAISPFNFFHFIVTPYRRSDGDGIITDGGSTNFVKLGTRPSVECCLVYRIQDRQRH